MLGFFHKCMTLYFAAGAVGMVYAFTDDLDLPPRITTPLMIAAVILALAVVCVLFLRISKSQRERRESWRQLRAGIAERNRRDWQQRALARQHSRALQRERE